jgi:ABC-type bacteriocin/lantibiotic exporter with double-glycine peptidase domain
MKKNLLPVKPFRETPGMCGPASLKMVLDYYGVYKTEKELAKLCKTTKKLGTSNEHLKEAAEKLGFHLTMKEQSSFEDIKKWLDKKVPVIVDWFTRGRADYDDSDIADGHYSVVVGLDKNYIYLQDPELGGMRKVKKEDFMTVWFDFKGKYIKPEELVIRQLIAIYE